MPAHLKCRRPNADAHPGNRSRRAHAARSSNARPDLLPAVRHRRARRHRAACRQSTSHPDRAGSAQRGTRETAARTELRAGLAAALLHGAAHEHQTVTRTGDATVDQNQVRLGNHLDDLLVQHAARLVAVLARHFHALFHAARRHVGTDGTTVTAVLTRTVGTNVTGEVMAAHDAGEAAALGRALHVHELTGFEELIDLQRRADLDGRRELGRATQLAQRAARLDAGFLERASERLRGVLLFADAGTDDDRVVAVFLERALA